MSDNVLSYQKFTNFLNKDYRENYESFKNLLYGSRGISHFDKIDSSGFGVDANRKGYKTSNRKTSCSPQYMYGLGENENVLGNANRNSCFRQDQANMEFSHFDELDRISSCLIRLLGEAREEHGKVGIAFLAIIFLTELKVNYLVY